MQDSKPIARKQTSPTGESLPTDRSAVRRLHLLPSVPLLHLLLLLCHPLSHRIHRLLSRVGSLVDKLHVETAENENSRDGNNDNGNRAADILFHFPPS